MQIIVFDRETDKRVETIKNPYSYYEASTHYLVTAGDDTMCFVETVIPKTKYYCMIAD